MSSTWTKESIEQLFRDCFNMFDISVNRKLDILKAIRSPRFIEMYRRLDFPEWTRGYIPVDSKKAEPIHVDSVRSPEQIVAELNEYWAMQSKSSNAPERDIEFALFEKAIGMRSGYLGIYCNYVMNNSVEFLMQQAKAGSKDALIRLVELDSLFLTLDFSIKLIREAELAQDLEFKAGLSAALNPLKKPKGTKEQKQSLAIDLIRTVGVHHRTYPEWIDFLDTFDVPFSSSKALAKACQRAGISKRDTKLV